MGRKIATILSLKDKISSPLTKVSSNVTKVTREMKKSQNQIEKWRKKFITSIDNVIKKASKIALGTGALAAGLAIKVGFDGLKELDEGSAKVKSIAKDGLKLKHIQKDLLKFSTATGVGVNEIAETQYQAISSGVAVKDSMKATVQATKLARAGFTDSENALKIMTSTMNVFGMTGEKAMADISDKLLITQNLGVTSVADLANSMGSLTPVANSAGASLDEMMAGMASLTKNGLKTEEAVTSFKGILSSVIKPGKEAADTAKQLGIDFSVGAIKSKGFGKFLEEIKEKTGGNTETMGKLFGNVRALSGALVLTGKGFDDFGTSLDAMKNSAGATEEAYKTMTNTLGWKLDGFKNTAKNTMTSIMQTQSGLIGKYVDNLDSWIINNEKTIQDWVRSIGDGIGNMIGFVKSVVDFAKKHEKVITTLLVFIGALYGVLKVVAIAKGALVAINTVIMILNGTLILSPFTWIALAIASVVAAGYLLYRNWDLIKKKASGLGDTFKTFIVEPILKIVDVLKQFGLVIWQIILEVVESFKPMIPVIINIFTRLKDIIVGLAPVIVPILVYVGTVVGVFFVGKFVFAFMLIVNVVKSAAQFIAEAVTGILKIFSGILDFIVGVFTNDWSMVWDGICSIFSGAADLIDSLWNSVINLLSAPVDAVVNILDAVFKEKVEGIKKLWESLKSFLKNPIKGVVNLFKKTNESGVDGSHKTGLPRVPWDGYIAELHAGERVLTKQEADNYNNGKRINNSTTNNSSSGNINIHIHGNVYGEDDLINKVGSSIYKKVTLAIENS